MGTIGTRIKEIRISNNLKQVDFGKLFFVSGAYISMVESGKEIPSDLLINSIALKFNVSFEWLKTGLGTRNIFKTSIRKRTPDIEGFENEETSECVSILLQLLNAPTTKENSEVYYRNNIKSILKILKSFFNRNDIEECEVEEIEAITCFIEKKIYDALEAFENEDLNEK